MLLFPYTIDKCSRLGYDNYIYILKQNFEVEDCLGLDYVPTMGCIEGGVVNSTWTKWDRDWTFYKKNIFVTRRGKEMEQF